MKRHLGQKTFKCLDGQSKTVRCHANADVLMSDTPKHRTSFVTAEIHATFELTTVDTVLVLSSTG